jgi:hypothetical protein
LRKLIASERMTLDGIFDADTMDKWFMPYHSDASAEIIKEGVLACDVYLLGRELSEEIEACRFKGVQHRRPSSYLPARGA